MINNLKCQHCGREFEITRSLLPEEAQHPLCPKCEAALQTGTVPPPLPPEPKRVTQHFNPSVEFQASGVDPVGGTQSYNPGATKTQGPVPLPSEIELPTIPGYRILGVLGRGGMGIVFKAEQIAANNRLVAIKMILAHLGLDEVQDRRFATEVNAVSSIEHPNIVRVYEVGDVQGKRYFTMEFCAGGTLYSRLKERLMAPKEAAKTVAILTRAMEVVHTKRLIHRDLKPLNVIYDARGVPKITDFGLAKDIEMGEGDTASGAIMGTLGYMSPEQASGKGHKATPETDIYALGAMLYSCLTGRVPFAGSSVPDTLQQIQKDDPVPVRKLVPKTPKDLETICEKCLQKEPTRRYRTAAELAEDLERYLDGRPILARPVSQAEKLWKAAKRRPAWAAFWMLLGMSGIGAVAAAVMLSLANVRERQLRQLADENAIRADNNAKRAQRFSAYMLSSLGEADFMTRYFPLYIEEDGKTGSGTEVIPVTPGYLRKLQKHALAELADHPHELAKVLMMIANAMRTNMLFEDCAKTLEEAEKAFGLAPETTPQDRERLQFSRACYLHEFGELEKAYQLFDYLLAQPRWFDSPIELADTKFRMGWLCQHRIVCRLSEHDALRLELQARMNKEIDEAFAIYQTGETPLIKLKQRICELFVLGRDFNKNAVKLGLAISKLPQGEFLLMGIGMAQTGEKLRNEGKFPEALKMFRELDQMANEKLGKQSFLRILALAALVGGENSAYERSTDANLKQQCLRDLIAHSQEVLAIGKGLCPRHPLLAVGYAQLAKVFLAEKKFPEARTALLEAQAIIKFHPTDLKLVSRQVEQELAKLPKP